jgi:hypothetical protein
MRCQLVDDAISKFAAQLVLVPPLDPAHIHVHGPNPLTEDAVPDEQRLDAGAALTAAPFAEPQAPLTGVDEDFKFALQLALLPPLDPSHTQVHGPDPRTEDAEPDEQRLDVGTTLTATPLAEPQAPLTGVLTPLHWTSDVVRKTTAAAR